MIQHQQIGIKLGGNVFEVIKTLASKMTSYNEIVKILSRIVVCTPHSADVERCISANNLVKTPLRNAVLVETESKYLHVHFNMPTLEDWNPRQAINMWLNEKQRREHSNLIPKKATNAPYFKGIFNGAHVDRSDTEHE